MVSLTDQNKKLIAHLEQGEEEEEEEEKKKHNAD